MELLANKLQVKKEANLIFLKSIFIGSLESSFWALSFQPLTFKKFQKMIEKKII